MQNYCLDHIKAYFLCLLLEYTYALYWLEERIPLVAYEILSISLQYFRKCKLRYCSNRCSRNMIIIFSSLYNRRKSLNTLQIYIILQFIRYMYFSNNFSWLISILFFLNIAVSNYLSSKGFELNLDFLSKKKKKTRSETFKMFSL